MDAAQTTAAAPPLTGTPIRERPGRYRSAVERLTQQDIAVFFQEALAELPQVVAELSVGGRVADVHCGGGRWLVAMARRFPNLELVGVEFEECVHPVLFVPSADGMYERSSP